MYDDHAFDLWLCRWFRWERLRARLILVVQDAYKNRKEPPIHGTGMEDADKHNLD